MKDLNLQLSHEVFDWHSPDQLMALSDQEAERLGDDWKTRSGRLFREAFIASRFAKFRIASSVRLLPENGSEPMPDFAVVIGGVELWFETTETDRPGRRRGEEPTVAGIEHVADEEWVSSSEYLKVVRDRSSKKAGKAYVRCDGLIIYDNAFPVSDHQNMTTAWWQEATVEARNKFNELWVLTGSGFQPIN